MNDKGEWDCIDDLIEARWRHLEQLGGGIRNCALVVLVVGLVMSAVLAWKAYG